MYNDVTLDGITNKVEIPELQKKKKKYQPREPSFLHCPIVPSDIRARVDAIFHSD